METVLLAAILFTFVTKTPQAVAMAKAPEGYDNNMPRTQVATLEGWGQRAAAAHQNAWEALLIHAIGVLTVMASGVDSSLAFTLAWAWFAFRTLYTAIYVAGYGSLRTLIWAGGLSCSLGLIAVAAGWVG